MTTPTDYSELSDEDFMKQAEAELSAIEAPKDADDADKASDYDFTADTLEANMPAPEGLEDFQKEGTEKDSSPSDDEKDDEQTEDTEDEQTEDAGKASDKAAESEAKEDVSKSPDHTTPKQSEPDNSQQKSEDASSEETAETDEKSDENADQEPDYKALYEQVMGSFKANGRDFKPASPQEAVRLMQMGANYTKKMQALKPNLRLMRMLENNDLLDESKINFLIDLDKKDPSAIQKLIHDAKIDPMEIDASTEPAYKPGNYSVSNEEMDFTDAVTDVASTDGGKETIAHIHADWDKASKDAIFKDPQLLRVINEQRANGIYGQISAEIERERVMGNLVNTPFIQAYRDVGARLQAAGKLAVASPSPSPTSENKGSSTPAPKVVESRTESPKKQMPNGDKAKAASSGPKAAKSKPQEFNPFTMTDDEIMRITSPQF